MNRYTRPRGSVVGALMFAIIIAAVLATASLAAIQVSRSRAAAQASASSLLQVGDRVQYALDAVNTSATGTALSRIDQSEQCNAGACTTLSATMSGADIVLNVTGTTPDGAVAKRVAVLSQLPTSGLVTGVDEFGRLQFVPDGGTGTDLWQITSQEDA